MIPDRFIKLLMVGLGALRELLNNYGIVDHMTLAEKASEKSEQARFFFLFPLCLGWKSCCRSSEEESK